MLPDVSESVGPSEPPVPAPAGPRGRTYVLVGSALVALLVAVLAAIALGTGSGDGGPTARTVRYLVPLGTGDRIDAGEDVQIIPSELTLAVGDELVLINEDDREHSVAGYQVRAGDTVSISYPRPGLYMNACSVNTDELVYITVVP